MTSSRTKVAPEIRLLKALGHPLRSRMLVALRVRDASPSELAEELGEPLTNVSYHMKILVENGAAELVNAEVGPSTVEHFYRATALPRIDDPDHWAQLSVESRRAIFDQTLGHIWDHVTKATSSGGFDDPGTHVSWAPFELDDEAYEQLSELLVETVDRALAIQTEANDRLANVPKAERNARRTGLAILHFDRPSLPAKAKAKGPGRKSKTA